MIRSAYIRNFRSLRDVELTLEPLTVLVGPNSSGKTTILRALQPTQGFRTEDHWQQDSSLQIQLELRYDDGGINIQGPRRSSLMQVAGGAIVERRTGQTFDLRSHLAQLLHLNLGALRNQNVLEAANQLEPDGRNLTNVFATLTRTQQSAIAKQLCELVPMFSDVDLQPTESGRHQLRFQDRWKPELWFSPNQVSDGTMLVLAFLVLQYQNPPVDLILIEEPERALHPYLLEAVISLMRRMTTGEIGKKPVQIVLATHSAEFLEHLRPEEVRFLSRSPEDGSVKVNQADTSSANWQRAYAAYQKSLGGVWLSGSMGGVPGT
ncbi:MAG TPA: AAA family ATPase [Myxococcus sp.]|nr:AAA family ATPase [Myxococcus sp.]